MPCEVISCTVNNTCIAEEPRTNNLESRAMHETKAKVETENNTVWTKNDLRQRVGKYHVDSSVITEEAHIDLLQNNLTFRNVKHKIFPRPLPSLEDLNAVTEECEPRTNGQLEETSKWFSRSRLQHCEPFRRYSTSSWPSRTLTRGRQRSREEFSSQRTHRRRQTEGFITSDSKVFGLVGYRTESVCILNKQRSDKHSDTNVVKRERPESNKTSPSLSVVSFDIMTSVAALDQPKSHHTLPRKLSHPAKIYREDIEAMNNGNEQSNSSPTDDCLRQYHFDSDTELQWQRLVARAKTLQLASPPRRPEIVRSGLPDSKTVQASSILTNPAGDLEKSDDKLSSKERKISEATPFDKADNDNQYIQTRKVRRISNERRYLLKLVPTLGSLGEGQAKANSDDDKDLAGDERYKLSHRNFSKTENCIVNAIEHSNRRHSVAVVRPVQQKKERVSGYSTHGALEYAKMLMEKIQEEGKTKSKKERLDEMSKVLKLVLEELNRIELPDRDLVSLFISLRAKMVNLRTELKADEGNKETESENKTDEKREKQDLSNQLPRPVNNHKNDMPSRARRFSWI